MASGALSWHAYNLDRHVGRGTYLDGEWRVASCAAERASGLLSTRLTRGEKVFLKARAVELVGTWRHNHSCYEAAEADGAVLVWAGLSFLQEQCSRRTKVAARAPSLAAAGATTAGK